MNARMAVAGLNAADWEMDGDFLRTAGRFANAVGALVAARKGGIPAMPERAAVEEFLQRYEPR